MCSTDTNTILFRDHARPSQSSFCRRSQELRTHETPYFSACVHVSTRRYPGRLRPATNSGPPRGEIPLSPRLRTSDEKRHAPPSRMRVLHSQEENSGHTLSRRVAADSACSYRTPPFQSLGAHPASEHLCSVLDPDRFGRESARIHRWSITAASRGAPRRARTKANLGLDTERADSRR